MKKIRAYHPLQMTFHKIAIVLTAMLIITGLPFFSKSFSYMASFIGYPLSTVFNMEALPAGLIVFRTIHWICGFTLLLASIIFILSHITKIHKLSIWPDVWGKEAIKDGITQLKLYYLENKEAKFGKLNMGQKAATWAMVIFMSLLFISGAGLVFAHLDATSYQDAAFLKGLHTFSFVILALVVAFHIFFALLPKNSNAYKAMFQTGELDEEFVKEHHHYWYEKLQKENSGSK